MPSAAILLWCGAAAGVVGYLVWGLWRAHSLDALDVDGDMQ